MRTLTFFRYVVLLMQTRRTQRWLFMPVLAMIGGCSLVPPPIAPPAPVSVTFPAAIVTVPLDSTSRTGTVDTPWQEMIADREARRLVELALSNNRDARIAALRIEQARAQYRVAQGALLPPVDASVGANVSSARGTTAEQYSTGVGISSWEIDLFGRLRSRSRQAVEQVLATMEGERGVRIALISDVTSQYFAWRRSRAQLALARRTLQALNESVALTTALLNAGQTTELDLRSAEGQRQAVRISLFSFERDAVQARNALELLVGTPIPRDLLPPDTLSTVGVLADIPPGLPSELLQRRPDILQAEHTLRAAEANIGVARAAFFPSIRLTGSLGRSSDQLSSLFNAGTGVWSLVPQLSVPLFRGGQNRANLTAAQLAARVEVATYERTIQQAFREVADALIATSTFRTLVDERGLQIAAQQRRLQLAELRYRSGEDAYLPVLTAQQDLFSAQQGLIDAQFGRLSSQLTLYRALGGGWR
jgi:outer membrane protein, multidrug efflux system